MPVWRWMMKGLLVFLELAYTVVYVTAYISHPHAVLNLVVVLGLVWALKLTVFPAQARNAIDI
jgi:hypothetical protein